MEKKKQKKKKKHLPRSSAMWDILIKFCIHIIIDKIQTKELPDSTFPRQR